MMWISMNNTLGKIRTVTNLKDIQLISNVNSNLNNKIMWLETRAQVIKSWSVCLHLHLFNLV